MNIKSLMHDKGIRLQEKRFRLPALFAVYVSAVLLAFLTAGCTLPGGEKDVQDREPLDYEVIEESAIPDKLLASIEEKKETEFKLSFENEDGLYLVHGYGEQETGGYSIAIRELSMTEQAVYFDTELLGPGNGSDPQIKPSYPYIVVRIADVGKNVVFD